MLGLFAWICPPLTLLIVGDHFGDHSHVDGYGQACSPQNATHVKWVKIGKITQNACDVKWVVNASLNHAWQHIPAPRGYAPEDG